MHTLWPLGIILYATIPCLSTPTVTLDSAVITGLQSGSLDKFLGIPYALPPIRFRKPAECPPYQGSVDATVYGPSCIQQTIFPPAGVTAELSSIIVKNPSLCSVAASESEDCLTINVIRPSTLSSTAKIPVVVWIYGGGFERGTTSSYDQMGMRIVERSVALSSPVIFVSMNYRVSAFGFLAGKEVMAEHEGNIGLLDQRLALAWVQKYIENFGGDKSKVMLWGQSAGAISIALQMLAYGGTTSGLFHAAFMMSGAASPTGNITAGQNYYDFLVEETGCRKYVDTLNCLRQVPISTLKSAVDRTPSYFSYESLVLAWVPRADGVFLGDIPQRLVQQGKAASIPFVSGNCDDEGTLFSLMSLNVTTEDDFREYVSKVYVPNATATELDPLWTHYPPSLEKGSPFDTGYLNGLTPQFKRLAAFQGDVVFQAARRFFLEHLSGSMKAWSYVSKRSKYLPFAGSYHGSDLELQLLDDFVIRMAVNHDPNNGNLFWPQYTTQQPALYTFSEFAEDSITKDTYRGGAMKYVMNLSLVYPL